LPNLKSLFRPFELILWQPLKLISWLCVTGILEMLDMDAFMDEFTDVSVCTCEYL
jgi:hypothetical protein